jgi:predicted acylesterase/phospholipase RssA
MLPQKIILSGGGVRGIAHIGALIELRKHNYLKLVKEWLGVSAGSILALMIVVGYTLEDMKAFSMDFDFSNIMDPDDPTAWIFKFGIDTGERLKRLIVALMKEKGYCANTTFKDLPKTPRLRVFATDIHKAAFKVFSGTLTPDYPVVDAILASCAIPLFFQPCTDLDNGNILMDGGVITNIPFLYLTPEEQKVTLGIILKRRIEYQEHLEPLDMFTRPMFIGFRETSNLEENLFQANMVIVTTRINNPIAFNVTYEDKCGLYQEGVDAVSNFIRKTACPPRRWSCS